MDEIVDWLAFYNHRRIHSSLGYVSLMNQPLSEDPAYCGNAHRPFVPTGPGLENLGLIPGYGGTQRLTKYIGKGAALEAILTGNLISAPVALQLGLVNHITTSEELLNKTKSILLQIISKAPLAITKSIAAVNAADNNGDGYALETILFGECFATDDMKEGTAAFLEKRQPVFKGV